MAVSVETKTDQEFDFRIEHLGRPIYQTVIELFHYHAFWSERSKGNYRKRLSDTWWLLSMRLRTRLGHGQYLFLC